jgi:RNA polymerase sigma factor (sigma-70 family)
MAGQDSDSDFDTFFRAVLPRAIGVARRITGDRAIAEDVAVEALAKAHLRWHRVGPLPWREAWVMRVASREALRHLPRGAGAGRRQAAVTEGGSVAAGSLGAAATTEDASDLIALRMALVAALRRLPARQREAISLRYLCDLSEADVAHALGVSPGAVKSHLHRGITTLRTTTGTDLEEITHGHIGA